MKLETHHAPRPKTAPKKEWSWSFSKLKNYEICPKRHYEVDIAKSTPDAGGEALEWGNAVHDTLRDVLRDNAPLPASMADYAYWVDRVRRGSGTLLVEQQYAITRMFEPTAYFAKNAWYRAKGDVVRINGNVGLVLDWKTGKVVDDEIAGVQLVLMAQCLFSHFPELTHVRSSYVWLKDDCETPELYTREEIAAKWVTLLPRVQAMEKAAQDQNFPPKPGHLCKKWCPVASCPHHGKGR